MRITICSVTIATLVMTSMPAFANDQQVLSAQARRMDSASNSPGQVAVSGKIASAFSDFAGSTQNADSLVTGLRGSEPILLTGGRPIRTVAFNPPTRPMGYGNVFISMSLAQQQLANYGIANPTPGQLEAAMVGGTITAPNGQMVDLKGVLVMRVQGMGWGQIAHAMGTKLGPVISGIKAANSQVRTGATNAGGKPGSGITTAGGTSASAGSHGNQGNGRGSGIVTAGGSVARSGGIGQGSGIVTAAGASAGSQGHGNAGGSHGRGL